MSMSMSMPRADTFTSKCMLCTGILVGGRFQSSVLEGLHSISNGTSCTHEDHDTHLLEHLYGTASEAPADHNFDTHIPQNLGRIPVTPRMLACVGHRVHRSRLGIDDGVVGNPSEVLPHLLIHPSITH